MIGIKYAEFYFPDEILVKNKIPQYTSIVEKNEELKHFFDQCGVDSVHVESNLSVSEMGVRAAEKLFNKHTINPEEVDLLIYISPRAPDFLMSSETTRVKSALECTKAFPLCLSDLGCVNISSALSVASAMMKSNGYSNALIVTGSQPFSPNRFRFPVSIIGDAGMAVYLTHSEENVLLSNQLEVKGEYWDLFKVDYKNVDSTKWAVKCRDIAEYTFKLAITSQRVFRRQCETIINSPELNSQSINHYLMQNISSNAYQFYEDSLEISFSPVCSRNLSLYGHLGSIDIILNYFTLIESGTVKKGDFTLILNNSPVAAWGSTLLQY